MGIQFSFMPVGTKRPPVRSKEKVNAGHGGEVSEHLQIPQISIRVSMKCAGQISPIHGGPALQPIALACVWLPWRFRAFL